VVTRRDQHAPGKFRIDVRAGARTGIEVYAEPTGQVDVHRLLERQPLAPLPEQLSQPARECGTGMQDGRFT